MTVPAPGLFSRRERQIMEILHERGEATAGEVRDAMANAPSYSAVRALLRVLENKGHVRHTRQGARYVYAPIEKRQTAARSALQQVVRTFFGGSAASAAVALLSEADARLSHEDLDRLAALIEEARQGGR